MLHFIQFSNKTFVDKLKHALAKIAAYQITFLDSKKLR